MLAWLLVAGGAITSLLTLYVVAGCGPRRSAGRADAPEGDLSTTAPAALLDDSEDVAFADRDDVGSMPVGC